MTSVKSVQFAFDSSPLFSANWLGRHPVDHKPRVVECFGPSAPDDFAAMQASALGLESIQLGTSPPMTSVRGEIEDQCLVLSSSNRDFLRTPPLSLSLLATLHWRPEVLLVWVDVPLRDPRAELPLVGLQHVWTGLAAVGGRPW